MSLIPNEEQSAAPETTESAETTTTGGEQTPETTEQTEVTAAKYLFADGVEGTGDAPEWFKSNKYKTVSDQAKAYTELESKFGAFKGAPKEGKYEIEGINFEENPLMATVAEWGLANQLSAEGLENLVVKVGELAAKQQEEDQTAAMKQLGENAQKRLADLASWGRNNLSTEEYVQFQGLAQTAGHVEVLEKLIGMTKNSKLVKPDDVTTNSSTKADAEAELKAAYLATNDKGQRLMEVDPAYRKKISAQMRDFYGN